VPGIRRSPFGRRLTESPSAVPGSRTRETENPLEGPTGEVLHATAGWRAGAEARGAPIGTEGRCWGPGAQLIPGVGCWAEYRGVD
jgi:hypothetical protein